MKGRTLGPAEQLKRMDGVEATADGTSVAFDIVTMDDKHHAFWTPTKNLLPFLRYLIDGAQFAVRVNGKLPAPGVSDTLKVDPIDSVALSVSPGRTNSEALLAVHIGAFPLVFSIDASAVKNLESAIKQLQVVKPIIN